MSQPLLDATKKFVQDIMAGDSTGHDWPHIKRVLDMACQLAQGHEGDPLDMMVVQMAALLHDVPDWKLTDDVEGRYALIDTFLTGQAGVSNEQAEHVIEILRTISWSSQASMFTNEGKIVQDADRLDALGAIGIARCFAYGGKKGRPLFEPKDLIDAPVLSADEYKKTVRSSVAHFYDKLLHLQEHMQTPLAKEIAARRTRFLEEFLDQFFKEWSLCD
jgi:uncharacterized protein